MDRMLTPAVCNHTLSSNYTECNHHKRFNNFVSISPYLCNITVKKNRHEGIAKNKNERIHLKSHRHHVFIHFTRYSQQHSCSSDMASVENVRSIQPVIIFYNYHNTDQMIVSKYITFSPLWFAIRAVVLSISTPDGTTMGLGHLGPIVLMFGELFHQNVDLGGLNWFKEW